LNCGFFEPKLIGSKYYDWDLVKCINEIRKYIYGGLREQGILFGAVPDNANEVLSWTL